MKRPVVLDQEVQTIAPEESIFPSTLPLLFVNNFHMEVARDTNIVRLIVAEVGPANRAMPRGGFVFSTALMEHLIEAYTTIKQHNEKEAAELKKAAN